MRKDTIRKWALVRFAEEIEDKVADYKLDHTEAKQLVADLKDGEITISEEVPALPATEASKEK